MLQHNEIDCELCIAEREKNSGSDFKILRRRLFDKVILPKNECWFCNIKFENIDEQLHHFSELHECDLCTRTFENIHEKHKHCHCTHCPKFSLFGSFDDKVSKEQHETRHCQYCRVLFSYSKVVEDHQIICKMNFNK